jgi:hypothetical protein
MSVKSASRHRELTASSATQFRSRFSSAKSDAYKVHALVRILFAQPQNLSIPLGIFDFYGLRNSPDTSAR